jgi:CheY-like chemotaxis protein
MTIGTDVIGGCAEVRDFGRQSKGDPAKALAPTMGNSSGSSNHPASISAGMGGDPVLPQFGTQALGTKLERVGEIPQGNGETVLLVEDEQLILGLAKVMLEKIGYRVLAAGTAEKALEIAEKHGHEIQLLLTGVLMPGMNGRDLAERLQTLYPGMKILFMSGYCSNAMFPGGMAHQGINFLPKPFTLRVLADKVGSAVRKKSVKLASIE